MTKLTTKQTIDALRAKTLDAAKLDRDMARSVYRALDCKSFNDGRPADKCSKQECIDAINSKLCVEWGTTPATADPLEIPASLKREVTPEGTAKVDQIVAQVNGGTAVPKMPASAVSKPFAKSNVETGTKLQKWFWLKDAEPKKLPKQAKIILDLLKSAGTKGFDRDAIAPALRGILKTKQPVDRIVSYYRSALVGGGYVKVV